MHYESVDGQTRCIEDEIPFEIPENWVWVRLGSIVQIGPRNTLADNLNVSFIPMTLIGDGYQNHHSAEERKWKDIKTGFTHFAEGDIGVAKITPCFENRKSVIFHGLLNGYGAGTTELHILRIYENTIAPPYLLAFCKSSLFIIGGVDTYTGTAGQQRIGRDYVTNTLFPLPPLAEQHRIVEKLEAVLGNVDSIDEESKKLDVLATQSKSKILDLAIRGKLVPQDPNDEPASVLLERIQKEKEKLVKAGKIKREKAESFIYRDSDNRHYEKIGNQTRCIEDEIPFEIPKSWLWVRLENVLLNAENQKPKGEYFDYLDIDSIDNKNQIVVMPKHMKVSQAPSRASRGLRKGDTIFSIVRPYLRNIAYIDKKLESCIASTGFYVGRPSCALYNRFLFTLFISDYLVSGVNKFMKGDNSPSIRKENLDSYLVPLPPIAEQQRIVAEVELLLKACRLLE